MGFEALDSTRMLVLMVAGGVFAAVGLFLMVRPRPQGAAKIELFGLKFESSSAGLLVFLIGAAFLSLPLWVEEKQRPVGSVGMDAAGGSASPPPADHDGSVISEVEPNDGVRDATEISLGQTLSGEVRRGDIDWIAVRIPDDGPRDIKVKVRRTGGSALWANVYDPDEKWEGSLYPNPGAASRIVDRGTGNTVYVSLSPGAVMAQYEVIATAAD